LSLSVDATRNASRRVAGHREVDPHKRPKRRTDKPSKKERVNVDHEYDKDGALDDQMRTLLAGIEKEPVSEELRALAAQLQKLLDERKALTNSDS
jgi:hypothetical protein